MSHNNNNPKRLKTEVCKRFQRGMCAYGDKCCFIHTTSTKPCWRFMNGETCQYGDTCHFTHGFKSSSSRANVMNGDELRDYRKMHMTWKTRLCHKWMASGTCRYGTNCSYAHGVSELQNQGSSEWLVKTCEENMDGKGWAFKWKNGGKISRVYADWIDDDTLLDF
ncbi:zinc finger, CCCH-type [Artemisia annua]|uniref:Zinc finger, CCCH-type n=1 Tax=Artemisia annua TaxID=35608 RepID=A0A2U1Q9W7_ARTAN|nr:zinc finger, CCCH-type [Artemisia annua]